MIKEYQVTLLCGNGTYKPVSCIVKREQYSDIDYSKNSTVKKELQKIGIKKICEKRGWRLSDLTRYNYTRYKVRAYNKADIERANKERYEQIKEQHYQDGSWKRSKNK